jgi:uncharacterized protein (TIGR00251 family)
MPTLNIKVIPNARKCSISVEAEVWKVHLNAPAVDGKANEALLEALADHFKVKKSAVKILKGHRSRQKVAEVLIN